MGDDVHHGGGDVLGPGDGRAAIGVGEAGVGFFGGKALAPGFRAKVFGIAARLNTHIGEQTVTWSNAERSTSTGFIGIRAAFDLKAAVQKKFQKFF